MVNEQGEYEQTTDRDALLRYFTIEKLTGERNYYGANKRKLGALKSKKANKRRELVKSS